MKMVKFFRTLGKPEVKNGYLNLTDDNRNTYGHLFPEHTTKFLIIDNNGNRSYAQQHHKNQIWGTLKNWYYESHAKAGDIIVVSYDPIKRIDGFHVLNLGLFSPDGAKRGNDIDETQSNSTLGRTSDEPFLTPKATDIGEPSIPQRHSVQTYRILRDTALSRWLKQLHEYQCQICGETIELANGTCYAEVHHIQPLGAPHNGPDILENMIVLCPNHHAMCDLGGIILSADKLRTSSRHHPSQKYIDYHNENIFNKTT